MTDRQFDILLGIIVVLILLGMAALAAVPDLMGAK